MRPESESTALESESTEVESESTRVESESGLKSGLGLGLTHWVRVRIRTRSNTGKITQGNCIIINLWSCDVCDVVVVDIAPSFIALVFVQIINGPEPWGTYHFLRKGVGPKFTKKSRRQQNCDPPYFGNKKVTPPPITDTPVPYLLNRLKLYWNQSFWTK